MTTLWKVSCREDLYPGLWQRWFKAQCVAIGWPPADGYRLNKSSNDAGWNRARSALKSVQLGDYVIVTLRGNKVGRLGVVTGKSVEDGAWDPLVPESKDLPAGELGRRLLVRWDLNVGPDSRDMVVALPKSDRFHASELRPTINQIRSRSIESLIRAMNDETNWIGLLTHFDLERALSGFIAAYPHRLEDGFLPHPNERVRERLFGDKKRLDVLLTDRDGTPVIVECKQGSPLLKHLTQIRHYMKLLLRETGRAPRGILVHGGSRKLAADVAKAARKSPKVEIVRYSLDVDFARSD